MPSEAKIFRVFVSSTFGDMVEERRALQSEVFPRLHEYCRQRGARFQAVDLRWGISAEAARDRRTMAICLTEVRRCRQLSPTLNFIALIGNRYGWRPLPTTIAGVDFDALASAATRADRTLLRRAYRRDDNAIPADRRLRPQPAGCTEAEPARREQALREALDRALRSAFQEKDPRQHAYGASATHLEIAERLSLDPEDRGSMLCYLREPRSAREIAIADRIPLNALKVELTSRLDANHVHPYRVGTGARGLKHWCKQIELDLMSAVNRTLRTAHRRPRVDAHESLATSLARDAVGQRRSLARIRRHVGSSGDAPLVITGVSGSGKSTLIARAWLEARAAAHGAIVIGRFVSATPESTSIDGLLHGICVEIDRALGQDNSLPAGADALAKTFNERLASASVQRPLVVFIDGVEQLEAQGAPLAWLPARLPPQARLVLSAVEDAGAVGAALRELRARWPRGAFVDVGKLSALDRERLLDHWLELNNRRLQPAQLETVLTACRRCPLPLFLRLAFEQVRNWRSYDAASSLAAGVPQMLAGVFDRLSAPAEHGPALVRSSLGLLCASRWGLAEDELLALLTADRAVMAELAERSPHWPLDGALPFVVWARLHTGLAPYLGARAADGTEVEAFFHGELRLAAEQFAFAGSDAQQTHAQLAAYFGDAVAGSAQPNRSAAGVPNRRKLSELAYQQTHAHAWSAVIETLTDLAFLQAKCSAGLTGDLIGDYDRATAAMRSHGVTNAPLPEWRAFIVRERAALEANAGIDGFVVQQAHNQNASAAVARAWRRSGAEHRGRRWLRLDQRTGEADAINTTLERHVKGVTDCVFDASGEWLFSSGMDGAVLAWRSADWGLAEIVAELPKSADSVASTADGRRVASACADGLVRIHDRRTRRTIVCEERFDLGPRRCRFVDQDRRLLAVGGHGLMLFDTVTGRLLKRDLDQSILNDCTATNDAVVTLGDCDGRVLVYDFDEGRVRHQFYLEDVRRVQGSMLSADGRHLLAAGGRFTAEDDMAPFGASGMWDLADESEIDEQRLPKPALNCLYINEERNYVVGLQDGTLRVHRSSDHALERQFKAHHNGIRGLALAPDGHELVSASFDGKLIVWRTAALIEPADRDSVPGQGLFCAVAADGHSGWAITASVDTYFARFNVQGLGATAATAQPVRPRELAELPIQRNDPGAPMQVYEMALADIGPRAGHRGSPAAGDGICWLVHAGARMSPPTFHLLPTLPEMRWSKENLVWARAAGGRQTGVVRATLARINDTMIRRVSLYWFADDRVQDPAATFQLDLPLHEAIGVCHFSADGRRLRLAVGPAVIEFDREGGQRRLHAGDSPVSAFCESPDGKLLLAAHADGHLQLWDAHSGVPLRRYDAHRGDAVDTVFVDPQCFVSIGRDGTLRLWRSMRGRCEAVFVARAALAAVDASHRRHRLLAVDVQGNAYWLSVERGKARARAELRD